MNEDVNGYRKLFWKEVSNAKGEKVESCSRVKDGDGRLEQVERESNACRNEESIVIRICDFSSHFSLGT